MFINIESEELVTLEDLTEFYNNNDDDIDYECLDDYMSACMYSENGALVKIRNWDAVTRLKKFWAIWQGNYMTAYTNKGKFLNDVIIFYQRGDEFSAYEISTEIKEITRQYFVINW